MTKAPPAIKDLLQPGDSAPIELTFAPVSGVFASASLLQVTMLDYANPTGSEPFTIVREPPGLPGDQIPCNLAGYGSAAGVSSAVSMVDFGVTTAGCASQTATITVTSNGPGSLCDVTLDGCGEEFELLNLPEIPACDANGGGYPMPVGGELDLALRYVPAGVGEDTCSLAVTANDGQTTALKVALYGTGTDAFEQTDTLTQPVSPEVDVLFVVGSGAAMSEEQSLLGTHINVFLAHAESLGASYHLGVVSADRPGSSPTVGLLQSDGGAQPRFFTPETGTIGFVNTVTSLSPLTGGPAGLEAAHSAVTPPLTSGPNWEFYRSAARLEVVFVSDRPDTADASEYLEKFRYLKGTKYLARFRAHAIVGDPELGCTSDLGTADADGPYTALAEQTGGLVRSICTADWAPMLSELGAAILGPVTRVFLSRLPADPSALELAIDEVPCELGFDHDPPLNLVLLDPAGPCVPTGTQVLTVHYATACLNP